MGALAGTTSAFAFGTLGTKWGLGPNVGTALTGNVGTPGSFTWSIMGAGLGIVAATGDTHGGATTLSFGSLIGTASDVEEIGILNSVFNAWASVSGLINLGQVVDGAVAGGASQASGGHLGDIRVGLLTGFGGELAHAFQPGTEALFGAGGTVAGDVHVNNAFGWVDDPNDGAGGSTFDLYTVLLHEVGHSLGLDHTNVNGSIMEPVYEGARRTLGADDLAGIQFIYGPEPVPEPATMAGLGLGIAWFVKRRKKQSSK